MKTAVRGAAIASSLLVLLLLSLSAGARSIGLPGLLHGLFRFSGSADDVVVVYTRLPRVVMGLLVGAALGVAGAILQGLTRNSLADPAVLGINSGAALALVVATTCLHLGSFAWRGPLALAGATVTVLVVYALDRLVTGNSSASLLILGSVLGGLMASITTTLLLCTGHDFTSILYWLVGSLNGSGWPLVFLALPLIATGFALSLVLPVRLNALRLGSEMAHSLGVDVVRTRALGLVAVGLLTAAAVASAGPIGFVGLLAAHFVRALVGPDYRRVLSGSAIVGGALVLSCDLLARTCLWTSYDEIPVGLVTACIGAPLLLVLLRTSAVQTA